MTNFDIAFQYQDSPVCVVVLCAWMLVADTAFFYQEIISAHLIKNEVNVQV